MAQPEVTQAVKDYYGKVLKSTSDIQSDACWAPISSFPPYIIEALKNVPEEAKQKYYGCGLAVPNCLTGMRVLDLGCGAGRDCFLIGQLVGPGGHVTGIDMTEELLEAARRCNEEYRTKMGLGESNVCFVHGYIEGLGAAGVESGAYDVVISNGVVNLSHDKEATLSEVYKSLKPGGELYFSDVYTDRELSKEIRENRMLWGECLGGAMDWRQLHHLAKKIGFATPRLVDSRLITVSNPDLEALLGPARFVSVTYRLFKVSTPPADGDRCVIYEGCVPHCDGPLVFDVMNTFEPGNMSKIDAELGLILCESRYRDNFTVQPCSSCDDTKVDMSTINPFECFEGNTTGKSADRAPS